MPVPGEGFSCRNPELWGAGGGARYGDSNLFKIGQVFVCAGGQQSAAQTRLSLKARDAEAGWIPSPQGHPARGRGVCGGKACAREAGWEC